MPPVLAGNGAGRDFLPVPPGSRGRLAGMPPALDAAGALEPAPWVTG
jgi:hypothetical protein